MPLRHFLERVHRAGPSLCAVVLLALPLACDDRVPSGEQTQCTYALDCAAGEACEQGRCVPTTSPDAGPPPEDAGPPPEDAGPPPEDAGPPPADAGPRCIGDALGNGTPETAHQEAIGDIDDGREIAGRLCPEEDEYFEFFGYVEDRYQVALSWVAAADADLRLYAPSTPDTADYIGLSTHQKNEIVSGLLPESGDFILQATLFTDVPLGIDYDIQIRSGFPCKLDDDAGCLSNAAHRCLMPVWTPGLASESAPSAEVIALAGLCALPYEPCLAPDNNTSEGTSSSRADAFVGMPLGSAWSCRYDEDWFRFDMPVEGHLTLTFSNGSTVPATYLLAVFDDAGNMLVASGYRELPEADPKTLVAPYLTQGAPVWVRVFNLTDDDLATYALTATTAPASCIGGSDCTSLNADDYGRTACVSGVCQCPAGACPTP